MGVEQEKYLRYIVVFKMDTWSLDIGRGTCGPRCGDASTNVEALGVHFGHRNGHHNIPITLPVKQRLNLIDY